MMTGGWGLRDLFIWMAAEDREAGFQEREVNSSVNFTHFAFLSTMKEPGVEFW